MFKIIEKGNYGQKELGNYKGFQGLNPLKISKKNKIILFRHPLIIKLEPCDRILMEEEKLLTTKCFKDHIFSHNFSLF